MIIPQHKCCVINGLDKVCRLLKDKSWKRAARL